MNDAYSNMEVDMHNLMGDLWVQDQEEGNHGTCKEKGCTHDATIDYNNHGHWVCQKHYDSLNDDFDKEYQ